MLYEARNIPDTPEDRARCRHEALEALSREHGCPIRIRYTWTKGDEWATVTLRAESREATIGEALRQQGHAVE